MTTTKHRERVNDFAKTWTNFMLETLVGRHLGIAGIHLEHSTVVTERLVGKDLLTHWSEVEDILVLNDCWPQRGYVNDTEAFLELVSPMEFYRSLAYFGLKLGHKNDGYGHVIEFQAVSS